MIPCTDARPTKHRACRSRRPRETIALVEGNVSEPHIEGEVDQDRGYVDRAITKMVADTLKVGLPVEGIIIPLAKVPSETIPNESTRPSVREGKSSKKNLEK